MPTIPGTADITFCQPILTMPDIVLTTLNAKYIHASIGLRSLYANLEELQPKAEIIEFTISDRISDIVETLLTLRPRIIGIGVYIWNALQVEQLIRTIKLVSPETIIILGGPEVSHPPYHLQLESCDYIVEGEGEGGFHRLCLELLSDRKQSDRIVPPILQDTALLKMPYDYYTDEDIAHRIIYVEASRGCPFSCEFCLSSIDRSVRYFPMDRFLEALETLWQRGARNFKFIDRTFNLNLEYVRTILDFFLDKPPSYAVHFEVVPEHFPRSIRDQLQRFKPGTLQLEVGIQTLDPEVARSISRNLDMVRITENLRFLEEHTSAHLHVDLIIGLPGESADSFGHNLNTLTELTRAEIQLGVLKKLSGTAISRHDVSHGMVYSPYPPYEILKNDLIDYTEMQRLKRFSRFWDLLYNSGNFNQSVRLIWKDDTPYAGFYEFSCWLYDQTQSTWKISLKRMAELLFCYLLEKKKLPAPTVADSILGDLAGTPTRNIPLSVRQHGTGSPVSSFKRKGGVLGKRQQKHLHP